MEEKRWIVLDWPSNSPDLNPIKYIQVYLKEELDRLFLGLKYKTSRSTKAIKKFKECITIAWDSIPDEKFNVLWKSMPRRVAAVIEARGQYTKY